MSFLKPVWGTPPDFVNELGVRWWKDADTTKYATQEDRYGTTLDAAVFFVEEPNGHRMRVMVQDGKVVAAEQALDALASKIDVLKFLKRDAEKERQALQERTDLPIAVGTRVRYSKAWLNSQSAQDVKRYQDRTGTVSGYRMGAAYPIVTFPKNGRLKEQKHYEVNPQDLEILQ